MALKERRIEKRELKKFIYIACPWTYVGGGMFKVADYLIQAQAQNPPATAVELRPLDTRGSRGAAYSLWVSLGALFKLARGRMSGGLQGVHINMAERLSLVRKSAMLITCRMLGIPVVLHLHAAQLHHFYRKLSPPFQGVIRWIFSLPQCVVVLGQAAESFVVDELKVAPAKVEVVINGVPNPIAVRRLENDQVRKRIFFLGSDWERKGLFDLIKALGLPGFDHEKIELIVAGRGDIEACRKRAQAAGVEGLIRFEGWADQKKAASLLAQADILVLPSYDEGLPLVILEALANGVAVVCTPVGEIPSVLSDNVDVYFVTPGDIPGLAAGLKKVLTDSTLRHTLEQNGRATYEKKFSMKLFFTRISDIHRQYFGVGAVSRDE